jgi:hypothetical protein
MMPRLWRSLLLGFALWLSANSLALAADFGSGPTDPGDPGRRILVMVKLPPEHIRPNADYGGGYGDGMGDSARRRIASRLARENRLTLVDDWPMPLIGVDCFVLAVPADQSPADVANRLSRQPGIAWSQPMNLYRAQGPAQAQTESLFSLQPAAREWRLAELHRVATGRNVRIAVIDSMIEKTHPDLAGQIGISQNFVSGRSNSPELHGTAVGGVIAAKGIGMVGVAPRARLMALRACWQLSAAPGKAAETVCDSLSLAKALDFAISHDAQVINMSLSGPPDLLLAKLLDAAEIRRETVVGAFDRDLPRGGFPASHPGVVAVADESWGTPPQGVYSAPGRDVPATTPGGHWSLVNGSSFAAAQVSGLIALLRERNASVPLKLVAVSPGGGAIDACATLLRRGSACDCVCSHLHEAAATGPR